MIKHYSFDLWFTLIKSNPVFKSKRATYFFEHFNTLHKSLEEVQQIFRQVDLMCNTINEKTGKNIDAEEMYLMVLYQLNDGFEMFEQFDLSELYVEMEKLIFSYSPTVFSLETIEVLERLNQQAGVSFNISSNTAFIKGQTLRVILQELKLAQYFNFQLYSDEIGYSKPNSAFYSSLLHQINLTRQVEEIATHEIIHVGDNPIADIYGAKKMGLQTFQINTNENTILNLLN